MTTTGTTTATTTTSTTSVVVACGPSLHCSAPEVCVIDDPVPACTKLTKGATCPESAPQQQCATGVELYDCCCIPAAAIAYRCVSAAACGDAPACECTPTGCLEGLECQPDRSAARTFHCGEHLWY